MPGTDVGTTATAPSDGKPKQPKRGDFNAGGQVRLPSGPDEMGRYASFNWVTLDLNGHYNLFDTVMLKGNIPVALIKPESIPMGPTPEMIGGLSVTLDAKLPKGPFVPKKYEADVRLLLTGSYMREGAMLLSEKDFPLFSGNFQPGFTAGAHMRVKLSSVVDFSTAPVYVQQATAGESLMAVRIPLSFIVKLGEVIKVSADAGVYTGNDFSFRGSDGGRIAAGGALTLKIGPILAHAGAGVASLLTGGMYPSIRDSFYIDLNVKYAK